MPGLLKRPHDRIDGEGQDPDAGTPEKKRQAMDTGSRENGNTRVQNGIVTNGYVPDAGLGKALEEAAASGPPELFHVTAGYISLSTVVERLAQETFIELEQLISQLADLQTHQVNGHGTSQSNDINVRKKELLFHFAHGYRGKFIKLLVLSQWSRQSEAVSKVIDIHSYVIQQRENFRNATAWMGELKRLLSTSKLPAADLRTALEVLSTGKAEWYADIGYTPKEKYTPKQLLKSLRTINTLLTIRLNLHEDIPPEMMDFSIQSGRATFRVKDEFELDLSIADEDKSSQLFFIDFRFSFSPCMTEIPEGQVRNHIEGRTNDVLRREGLAGCYQFLHELVLTHKLTIVRQQAFDMARSRWSENIRVEPVHRSVVIPYWINRPGPKSWIEIGTKKPPKKIFGTSKAESHISLRWHRHGKEVLDHGIDINAADLNIESVLKQIIAAHTNYIFKKVKKALKEGPVYSKDNLNVKHKAHPREPAESSLKMQITQSTLITISQEPISGNFSISPSSQLHFKAERDLNRLRDPATEAASKLALLRCNETLAQVETSARVGRWQRMQAIHPNQETIRKFFGQGVLRMVFYKISNWHKGWALVLTAGHSGDQWWAVELKEPPRKLTPTEITGEPFHPISKALPIKLKSMDGTASTVFHAEHKSLAVVKRSAAAVITQFVNVRELTKMKDDYRLRTPIVPMPKHTVPDIFIRYVFIKDKENEKTQKLKSRPAFNSVVKASYMGLSRSGSMATTLVTARLHEPIPHINMVASALDSTIAFHPRNGDMSFRLEAPVGASSVPEIQRRLTRAQKLIGLIRFATERGELSCKHISLNSITVLYGSVVPFHRLQAPDVRLFCTATLNFPESRPRSVTLAPPNPHLRVLDSLNLLINEDNGVQAVLYLLHSTLYLLRGLDAMESNPHKDVELRILPRSATCFMVRYRCKSLEVAFEIKLRTKSEDGYVWFADMNFERGIVASPRSSRQKSVQPSSTPSKAGANAKPLGGKPDSSIFKDKDKDKDEDKGKGKPPAAESEPPLDPEAASELASRQRKHITASWKQLTREKGSKWYGLGGGILAQLEGGEPCLKRIHKVLGEAVVEADKMTPIVADKKAEGKIEEKKGAKASGTGAAAAKGAQGQGQAGKKGGKGQDKEVYVID